MVEDMPIREKTMKRSCLILFAASLCFACTGAEGSADKGNEESPLTNGKGDSFFRPTEHGEASFARANRASITEDESFHAWTFELSAEATLELKSEISTRNLDTVMYLYTRKSDEESWGSYIDKNDDHDGNLWSQIDGTFDAGQYRVIIKPFKTTMTGEIALVASCDGDGCPEVGAGECTPDVHASLPAETGYGPACDEAILEVVTSQMQFSSEFELPVDEKCDLDSLAAKAVDYYVSYWNDIVGFDEIFGSGDPNEPVRLHVEQYSHERGTVIWIDAFADEDGMRFVFDFEGNLLGLYQSNQSPDHRFYCADEADITTDFPACWSNSIEELRWTIDSRLSEEGTVTVDEAGISDELNNDLITAIYHFSEAHALEGADEMSYELITWEGSYTYGAEITLTHEQQTATYWIGNTELVAITDGEGTRYLCEFVDL